MASLNESIQALINAASRDSSLTADALREYTKLYDQVQTLQKERDDLTVSVQTEKKRAERLSGDVTQLNATVASLNTQVKELAVAKEAAYKADFENKFNKARGDEMKDLLYAHVRAIVRVESSNRSVPVAVAGGNGCPGHVQTGQESETKTVTES